MIIATAGHVDHGKTSLVKQLTGVDTDRLEEEKRRGLSINLGFAYADAGNDKTLGFIDVPGHARFINTMIAGVGGIDLALLVVAADDGPMPQTQEHLDVLRLLGVRHFVVAITKIDRVDDERVDRVASEVTSMLAEGAGKCFSISNQSGAGVPALRDYLNALASSHQGKKPTGNFRLPVDRAFLLNGVGLVVTGTATAGEVAVGDALRVMPLDATARVRSLRVQDSEATRGQAGDRCALNLVGDFDQEQIGRGATLVGGDGGLATRRIDVRVSLLANAPFALKHLAPVKVHLGSGREPARLYLLGERDQSALQPGAQGLAQLIFEEPVCCYRGDRFLLRDDSESVTLGGGVILDPFAPRSGKAKPERLLFLQAMDRPTAALALAQLLEEQGAPVDFSRFANAWNLNASERERLLAESGAKLFESGNDEFLVSPIRWDTAKKDIAAAMGAWHNAQPQESGIKPAALALQLQPPLHKMLFQAALLQLLRDKELRLVAGLVQRAQHRADFSAAELPHWQRLQAIFSARGLQLPLLSELESETGLARAEIKKILKQAGRAGQVIRVNDNRFGLPAHLKVHAATAAQLGEGAEGITVVNYKRAIDSGRKLAIDILEHFDAVGYTRRQGDKRVIVNADLPERLYKT